jgi:hypothetical protein
MPLVIPGGNNFLSSRLDALSIGRKTANSAAVVTFLPYSDAARRPAAREKSLCYKGEGK